MPTTHNFDEIVRNYQQFKSKLPRILGQEAVNFSKDNFRKQGFHDNTVYKWKKRKARSPRNKGRAILVDTGALKRSIRVTRVTTNRAYIGSNLPYARIHNEGGRVRGTARVRSHARRKRTGRTQVRAHSRQVNFRMPRRRFIGPSVELNRRLNRHIRLGLLKVFK